MALIIEDGTEVANANSYVTAAEIEAFADARGVTLTDDPDFLAIKAMDYLESLTFIGYKATATQALQWPRENVYIDGYSVSASVIPSELKKAQMTIALAVDAGESPLASVSPGVKREKVGDLEVEYQDGAGTATINTAIRATIGKLLSSGGSGSTFAVSRS